MWVVAGPEEFELNAEILPFALAFSVPIPSLVALAQLASGA